MPSSERSPRGRQPARSDGRATYGRILEAATAEFATHGIAGARVDRIADASGANKSQLYSYFGSKAGLFDAVLNDNVEAIVDAAPLDGADLPGYAVALYDAYLERPEMVRLVAWNRLERRPSGHLFGEASDVEKLASIVEAQRAGSVTSELEARDIHALVIAMALAWSPVSFTEAGELDDPAADRGRRRRALAAAVAGAFAA